MLSPETLRCASAKPNLLLASSRDIGWRSLLLDHQQGRGRADIFETHRTDDVTLVVATRGRSLIQVAKSNLWHTAVYEEGASGLTEGGDTTRMFWQALDSANLFETANIYLPAMLVAETADEYRRAGTPTSRAPLSALVFRDPTIASVAQALLSGLSQQAPALYADQTARFLIAHLLAHQGGGGIQKPIAVLRPRSPIVRSPRYWTSCHRISATI